MAAGPDLTDGFKTQCIFVDFYWLKAFGDQLQQFRIQDHFFVRPRKAALQPPGRSKNDVGMGRNRRPQAHFGFIGGLSVDTV